MTVVQQTIEQFNATAGGPTSAQQAQLATPVYARLAPAPGWKPTSGTLPGAVYSLPTLIRVYTGDRITSTDLTDLHVAIQDGKGWLPALCLS